MHILRFTILCGLIASSPALAIERYAHLQPTRETMLPHVSLSSASEHRADISHELELANQKSKSKHDGLEKKTDLSSRNSIASICSSCLESHSNKNKSDRHRFASTDGSLVSAEWVYSRRGWRQP